MAQIEENTLEGLNDLSMPNIFDVSVETNYGNGTLVCKVIFKSSNSNVTSFSTTTFNGEDYDSCIRQMRNWLFTKVKELNYKTGLVKTVNLQNHFDFKFVV